MTSGLPSVASTFPAVSNKAAAKTKLTLARMALQTGKPVNRKDLDQAIQTFQKLGAQVDLAEALQIEGEL